MPGDQYKRFKPGDPLEFYAPTLNDILDAAAGFKQRKGGAGTPQRIQKNACLILVRNDTDTHRNQFDVLGIDGVVVSPSEDDDATFETPILKGVTPNSSLHSGKFVILQEPLGEGEVGLAIAAGITWARVHFGDDADEWCDAGGETNQLTSGLSGSARVLYREREGNPIWALIKIGTGSDTGSIGSISPAYIRKMTLDGDQVWAFDTGGAAVTDLVYQNGRLLSAEASIVRSINPDTAEQVLRLQGCGTAIAANASVIASSVAGSIFIVLDHGGLVVWAPSLELAVASSLAVGPDGYIYVYRGGGFGVDSGIVAYAVGNSTLLREILTSGVQDIAFDSVSYLIAVTSYPGTGNGVNKYDTANALAWNYSHGASLLSLAVGANDKVLIGGNRTGGNITTRLLDSSGAVLWSADHGGTVRDVCFDDQGNCYTTGDQATIGTISNTAGTSRDSTVATTRKYDPSGNLLWSFDWGASSNAILVAEGYLYIGGSKSNTVHLVF